MWIRIRIHLGPWIRIRILLTRIRIRIRIHQMWWIRIESIRIHITGYNSPSETINGHYICKQQQHLFHSPTPRRCSCCGRSPMTSCSLTRFRMCKGVADEYRRGLETVCCGVLDTHAVRYNISGGQKCFRTHSIDPLR